MNTDLRTQALERMKQWKPSHPSVLQETPVKVHFDSPHKQKTEGLSNLLQTFDLDTDRIILLAILIFLYADHASPKILLAILYIML